MKHLRLFLIPFFSLAFLIAQAPSPAVCTMMIPGAAMTCSMSCCKSLPKSGHCPMMKAAPPLDLIALSALVGQRTQHVPAMIPTPIAHPVASMMSSIHVVANALYGLFLERPSLARAPPASCTLLSA